MARRRTKKKSSNKLLKTAILLILFIGLWFVYNHTDIPARIQNALRPHKPSTVQTVPEPEVPPPSTKTVTYTVKNPQFDNLSYGTPGAADSIIEREGYALGYIEKHEQPPGEYNRMLTLLIEKAVVWNDRLEIEFKTGGVKSLMEELKND